MRYTYGGHTITPLWETKRRVAGGYAIDVIVHDEFHKGSRRQATVNADNIEEVRA
jgi:hypothetical protein